MTLSVFGTGTSRGIAIGRAHLVSFDQPEIRELTLDEASVADEMARYRSALETAREQLRAIRDRIPETTPRDVSEFFDAHLLMLEDATLSEEPLRIMRERRCNAEWALKLKRDALASVFEEMDDPYLRVRRDDVDHVVTRIQRILQRQGGDPGPGVPMPQEGEIIVADDIAPADVVLLQDKGIAGLITEFGSPLSHTAILARSLRLPMVVGARRARSMLHEDDLLVVDGERGVVLADCSKGVLGHYQTRRSEQQKHVEGLQALKHQPSTTRDGTRIHLRANVELLPDVRLASDVAADGVGLYRTEFLFLNRAEPPDEEEQYQVYLEAMETLDHGSLTIRTLDLGADKALDQVRTTTGPLAINPALGLRAVRMCLANPGLFRPQVRAILRLSAHPEHGRRLRVMIPMLSNVQEIFQVRHLFEAQRRELRAEGVRAAENIPLGGMIEVPAAAVAANIFAKHLDFMSIGTNDLIQYTLAMDRIDDAVSYLYDPLHPGVLRLLDNIIRAGQARDVPVGMCGEMASDPRYTRLLMGMGLHDFSMHPASVLEVKQVVVDSDIPEIEKRTARILHYSNPATIAGLVHELNEAP